MNRGRACSNRCRCDRAQIDGANAACEAKALDSCHVAGEQQRPAVAVTYGCERRDGQRPDARKGRGVGARRARSEAVPLLHP